MKRLLHILLSALSFGSMSCVPFVEEEVDMYAAPYTEFRPSNRVDDQIEESETSETNSNKELESPTL